MVTLNFYTLDERKPAHKERVLYIESREAWGFRNYEFHTTTAEYCWFCRDLDGIDCGDQVVYDPIRDADFALGDQVPAINDPTLFWVLDVIFDHVAVNDITQGPNLVWMPVQEFWAAVDPNSDQSPTQLDN